MKTFYRRTFPHYQFDHSYYFVTFRLFNSLPIDIIQMLKGKYRKSESQIIRSVDESRRYSELYNLQKKYFGIYDRYLDKSESCTNYLADERIAKIVSDTLFFKDSIDYDLICYCIMPNHVHMLLWIEWLMKPFYKIMQSIKRFSSRKSNLIINRSGTFWEEENYDHIVRDREEYIKIVKFILTNPLRAGLVSKADDWEWIYCKYDMKKYKLI